MKRELWEMITELVEALVVPQTEKLGLRVIDMTVQLPVELVIVQTAVGFRLLIDAPHYRWDTGLRPETSQLQLALCRIDAEEAVWLAEFGS